MSDAEPTNCTPLSDDEITRKHFAEVQKALYDLVGLFVTGPLKKEPRHSEVRMGISALAQVANDRFAP